MAEVSGLSLALGAAAAVLALSVAVVAPRLLGRAEPPAAEAAAGLVEPQLAAPENASPAATGSPPAGTEAAADCSDPGGTR